jgi:hypothetical protein
MDQSPCLLKLSCSLPQDIFKARAGLTFCSIAKFEFGLNFLDDFLVVCQSEDINSMERG